jgi:hypothetical protein
MGRRSEPRKQAEVPVRIFGTDSSGQVFSENVRTVDISRNGVALAGVRAQLSVDEIVGITVGANRVHFRVKWIGKPGTPQARQVGLVNISPTKVPWDIPLPPPAPDNFALVNAEQRQSPRFRCQNPVEIHANGGASYWGTLSDLSLGGCYVEMAVPLEPGERLRIGLWLGQAKIWSDAQVSHRTRGMGFGVKFVKLSPEDREQIRKFLETLSPFAKKAMRPAAGERSVSF